MISKKVEEKEGEAKPTNFGWIELFLKPYQFCSMYPWFGTTINFIHVAMSVYAFFCHTLLTYQKDKGTENSCGWEFRILEVTDLYPMILLLPGYFALSLVGGAGFKAIVDTSDILDRLKNDFLFEDDSIPTNEGKDEQSMKYIRNYTMTRIRIRGRNSIIIAGITWLIVIVVTLFQFLHIRCKDEKQFGKNRYWMLEFVLLSISVGIGLCSLAMAVTILFACGSYIEASIDVFKKRLGNALRTKDDKVR